jgi:transposase InsO family protein
MPDNGICERFHRTVLDEFYRIAFRKKIYQAIEELQSDLDTWLVDYNQRRPSGPLVLRQDADSDLS